MTPQVKVLDATHARNPHGGEKPSPDFYMHAMACVPSPLLSHDKRSVKNSSLSNK